MTSKHIPLWPEVKDRKVRFAELNEFVRSRGGCHARFAVRPREGLDRFTRLILVHRIKPHSPAGDIILGPNLACRRSGPQRIRSARARPWRAG